MQKVSIVLVGGNGYGKTYLEDLLDPRHAGRFDLVGVVEPSELDMREEIRNAGVGIFNSLEQFYDSAAADLAIVSTPPFLHESMSCYCMERGSNVLCEKPVTPTLQQARHIQQCIDRTGRMFGVGFQWSFNPAVLSVKKDILGGRFGKPLSFWTFTSWPRPWRYFTRSWVARLFDAQGGFLLDSVASNATAHHLHNSLFLLGDSLDSAAQIKSINAELYRANSIDSYDTCAVKYNTVSGVEMGFIATHAAHLRYDPQMEYCFENGVLRSIMRGDDPRVSGFSFTDKNGAVREYDGLYEIMPKTLAMVDATASGDDAGITCKLSTALPHLTLCNAMLDFCDITDFPADIVRRNEEAGRSEIPALYDQLNAAFVSHKLPSEMGYDWAKPGEWHDIENYRTFSGSRLNRKP